MNNSKIFRNVTPMIHQLNEDHYFDISDYREIFEVQATTHAEAATIRALFPKDLFWDKEWKPATRWWEYTTKATLGEGAEEMEINLRIYAITEGAKQCKAIIEKQVVQEEVATHYETRNVTKDVIVGWDCGDALEEDDQHTAPMVDALEQAIGEETLDELES